MTPHTPGPFHADHSGGRIAIWALGDKRVFLGACSEKEIGRRQAEANAALFVAAPDLLAACEELIQDAEARPGAYLHARGLDEIRAAIAKAKGEHP